MHIHVDTIAGPKGEQAPSSLRFDGRNVGVANVVDNWWGPGERFYKVKDVADNIYLLRHDEPNGTWELLMFVSKRGSTVPDLLGKTTPRRTHAADGKI